jgi:amino acid adenylation domain-containing protein/non-ribosomal peptide synthase protein (TIGR01720 family)
MVIALLGVLKTGAAYLPLDPAYPAERLGFMLQDAQVSAVVTQRDLLANLPIEGADKESIDVVCLEVDQVQMVSPLEKAGHDRMLPQVHPADIAYVIYTSGSTGMPKGVPVSHRSVVNHNLAVIDQFRLDAQDRILQFSTINFDAAVEELFPALAMGATVVLREGDMLATGRELVSLIARTQLTVLDLPTAYWHEWVYELSLFDEQVPPSLRLVVVGGEKASAERLATWQKLAGPHVTWMNTYGPTEGTIIATAYELPPSSHPADEDLGDDGASGAMQQVPIGYPIANVRIYLLDLNLEPVPIGVPGELYIAGAGVAEGYLGRPALTAERFVPDPYGDLPGARMYRSGDLARYRQDGSIEFVGRADHQVKVRGFRVEPGEIEAILEQHEALKECAVIAQSHEGGHARLVAYFVPAAEAVPTETLRRFLGEKLPEYMIPSTFVQIEAMPLTPSGKVNRQALPAPELARPDLEAAYAAPQTQKEKILAEIWRRVLGVEQVSVRDNFFELGGDSILSIQVIARASQAGLRLTPRQLFQSPTVAGLAAVADTSAETYAEQGVVVGPVPLTPVQHGLLGQDLPEPHHWNQAVLFEVRQPLELEPLKAAVEQIMKHHDALRLRFTRREAADESGSAWNQVCADVDQESLVAWLDLSDVSPAELSSVIEAHATRLQGSLNLESGPLLQIAYMHLGGKQGSRRDRLLVVIHHLAIDGVSWRILMEDLWTAYQQLARGDVVRLPPKTTSFQRWAHRLVEYAQSDVLVQEAPYWLNHSPKALAHLPVDNAEGANTEASASSVRLWLTAEETQALLGDVPNAYGTEINDVLLTALAQTIARWSGSSAVLVDLEGHGREDIFEGIDLSRTVGWFTAIYPVFLQLEDGRGSLVERPGAAIKVIKEKLHRVPQHGLGYGVLRYLCHDKKIAQRLSALPKPEICFNYLGQFDQVLDENLPFVLAREPVGPSRSLEGEREYKLIVNGGIHDRRLQIEWGYSENVHHRTTIERLAQTYVDDLRTLIAHSQSVAKGASAIGRYTPSDFPDIILDQEDIDAVMAELEEARSDY